MPLDTARRTLASNTRQARKVRVLTWAFSALAVAACAWAAVTLDPAAQGLAPIGVVAAAALHVYCARYVILLELDGKTLVLRTARLGAPEHRVPRARVGRRTYHEGRAHYVGAPSVHAPWITLRVEGYRLPFVIDARSELLDRPALERL